MPALIVYTKDGCGPCTQLKMFLKQNGVDYIESKDYPPGLMSVPAVSFKGEILIFPAVRERIEEIKEMYGN